MSQQTTLTGTFSDASQSNVTAQATFAIDDTSLLSVSSPGGLVSYASAGKIYGGQAGVSASIGAVTSNSLVRIIAADSGSQLMPLSDRQWTDLGLSPWGSYGGCQESTGSLLLSGSVPYTLSPFNSAAGNPVSYSQTIGDGTWTRVGVGMSGSVVTRFNAAAGVGPNPATDSIAMLAYLAIGPSTAASQFFGVGAAAAANRLVVMADTNANSSGQVDVSFQGSIRRTTGPWTNQHSDRVHPYLLVYNRTAGEFWTFTDQCLTMSGSVAALVDGTKMFGGNNAVSASGTMVYWATCTGSVAESLAGVNQGGAFLQTLGWNVPYLNCASDSGTIRCPTTPACWQSIGLRPWSAAHNLQEATGSAHSFDVWDKISAVGWTLTPVLNVTYRNAQPGWTRRSTDIAEVISSRLGVANNLVGSYTGSVAFMGYSRINSSAGSNRSVLGGWNSLLGGQFRVQTDATGVPQLNCSGTVSSGLLDHRDGRVHPFLAVYDVTNSRAKLYTDREVVTGSFGVLNQVPTIGMGSLVAGQTPAGTSHLYFAACTGSVAEILSTDGQASAFLKGMGWQVVW